MKIPKSKVPITRVYLVDCEVCAESVVGGGGDLDSPNAFHSRRDAEEAQRQHVAAHETGYFE